MIEDDYYNRRFVTNGKRLLENFYSRRRSLEPLERYESTREEKIRTDKQRALKWKLSDEYFRLLKENNDLREFVKNYHFKIKGNNIVSVLDNLKTDNKSDKIMNLFDNLNTRISNTIIY